MNRLGPPPDPAALRDRLVAVALREAARHDAAFHACLGELAGPHAPDCAQVTALRRRAARHLDRSRGLGELASRVNRDPANVALLAGARERRERHALFLSSFIASTSKLAANTVPAMK